MIGVIAETGGEDDFELFWKRHQQVAGPQLSIRYLHSLARFTDAGLADRLLDMATSEVKTQDAPFTIGRALANRDTGRRVWDFVSSRWDDLLARFPANTIVRMVSAVASITDRQWAEEVAAFFESHAVPQGEKTLAQNLERMWNTVRLKERESSRFLAG